MSPGAEVRQDGLGWRWGWICPPFGSGWDQSGQQEEGCQQASTAGEARSAGAGTKERGRASGGLVAWLGLGAPLLWPVPSSAPFPAIPGLGYPLSLPLCHLITQHNALVSGLFLQLYFLTFLISCHL